MEVLHVSTRSSRFLVSLLALVLGAAPGLADAKPRIDKAADLPRFTYRIDGKAEDVVRDPAKFAPFAAAVQRDVESVLAGYEIDDHATLRQLEGELALIDYLQGRRDDALARLARIKALQDKPAEKLMSGLVMRTLIEADAKTGSAASPAGRGEVGRLLDAALARLPYDVVQNEVKELKASFEVASEALTLGYITSVVQPTIDQSGGMLSSDLAPALIGARYRLAAILPIKDVGAKSLERYLAAHHVEKPDIWAARDVSLPPGKAYHPVNVAIWDSGVDLALFPGRVVDDRSGKPAVIAFDRYSEPAKGDLQPIPADLLSRIPQLKARLKGFSDLQSNIDSPEATEVKQYLSTLKPDEYKSAVESLGLAGNWMHGTHVAGIATAGNPYARIVVGRIEFDWHLLPDPCPSRELAERDAKNAMAYVDFFKRHHVRVVNMSWGGSVKGVEEALEMCHIGKDPAERKKIARDLFDIQKSALTRAFESAPGILFVAAAGNSNQNASFAEDIPADIALPNLVTVGAVDQAGDEASFTSYGPTVVVDANGYQVESVIPGGEKLAESGTSMASPQVANLAAKMLAVDPELTPREIIAVIRDTADTTPDGRRNLINPKKALAKVAPTTVRAE
ncbi:MAG: S8 family serine peptidase [Proteobacteria bacterium]|nr:S8 family serine peptidase [Pseudomonadota bacterium]